MRGVLALLMLPGGLVVGSGCDAVCEGDFVVETQADLNALAGCVEVDGNLEITSAERTLTLESLRGLERVSGRMRIAGTALRDLSDLKQLREVGGPLDIYNNSFLESVTGLYGLQRAGALSLEDNPPISVIRGFDSLVEVGALRIQGNRDLRRVWGFNSLARATGPLHIDVKGDIQGFNRLESTLGSVTLTGRDRSTTPNRIDGFAQLRSLGEDPTSVLSLSAESIAGFDHLGPDWGHGLRVSAFHVEGLPDIETVAGDVEIEVFARRTPEAEPPEPWDALGFVQSWRAVGGDLVVGGAGLTSLAYFGALESVGGELDVGGAFGFSDVGGFFALAEARGITLRVGPEAAHLYGFEALQHTGELAIVPPPDVDAGRLETITGFDQLHTVDGPLVFRDLPGLTRITGFSSLTSVGQAHPDDAALGSLYLHGLPALSTIEAFGALRTVAHTLNLYHLAPTQLPRWADLEVRHLFIVDLPVTALRDWPSMVTLDSLTLRNNSALYGLGLAGLVTVTGRVEITNNPSLSCADAMDLVQALSAPPAEVLVDNNLGACF